MPTPAIQDLPPTSIQILQKSADLCIFKPKFEEDSINFSLTLERDRMSSRFEASLSSMSDLFFFWGGAGEGLLVFCLFVKLLGGLWDPNEELNLGLSSESIV